MSRLNVDDRVSLRELHFREQVMGTTVTIDVHDDEGVEPARLWPYLEKARADLQLADQIFSTWREDSPMSQVRRGILSLFEAPQEVTEVLEQCLVARALSGGWFDPWAMPGGVDPTGYVKGWAAQRALERIAFAGVTGAVVNAAGDVTCFGGPSPDAAFRVGVANPVRPRTIACVVELRGAIATSGTYERGLHLIDPHTELARCQVASASVCGPDLGMADALATALAVCGEALLATLEGLDGYDGLVIDHTGAMRATSTFPFAASAQENGPRK